jgi:hypothetical protein
MEEKVSPVLIGHALESLRNSDFDTYAAIGEVIDNSLEAGAKNIKIEIVEKTDKGKRKPTISEIVFADDGMGMDRKTLHRCLQLGYSSSYNDRKGIGRFGVGMTLGAISQCKRIEVYSKLKGDKSFFTYIDLDEIKNIKEPNIPPPIKKEIPKEYARLIGGNGTLVIWKKFDRVKFLDEADLNYWIARTYRKFIGTEIIEKNKVIRNRNQAKIYLKGQIIHAFDPLYVTKNSNFPQDETATLYPETVIDYPISEIDPPSDNKMKTSKIIIRMSFLPESWRSKSGQGRDSANWKRFVHKNEGISILRNNREVFYGHIPNFELTDSSAGSGFIDIDRWWGCEICFDADLDHWFSVKNIKVGARPLSELRKTLIDHINPTIYSCRKKVRAVWSKNKTELNIATQGAVGGNEEAENILAISLPRPDDNPVKKKNEITALIKNAAITTKETELAIKEKLQDNPLVFVNSSDVHPSGPFIDVAQEGMRTLITMNARHPFFYHTNLAFENLREISKKKDDQKSLALINKLETSMKLLYGTFGRAQKDMIQEKVQSVDHTNEQLLNSWSTYLKQSMDSIETPNVS